jgi:PIN domain nuclease of toxin-antitoxin system
MKILIDTQVLVWLLDDRSNLGVKATQLLTDTSNQVYISYFSFYEIAIKTSIGKMTFEPSVIDDLPKMGIDLIMPSIEHLAKYKIFNPNNKDPFDNVLLTVASATKYVFMTSDEKILDVETKSLNIFNATK